MTLIVQILTPSRKRTELGNELRLCVNDLLDVRNVLWSEKAPSSSAEASKAVSELLQEKIDSAPRRGKGARRRRFAIHMMQIFKNYSAGLFKCYDQALIPQTTNELEGKHGTLKHHVRKTLGRASTAGGVVQSLGELLACVVDTVSRIGFGALIERIGEVSREAYEAARRKVWELREPARAYRSIQRNPKRHLKKTLEYWEAVEI